MRVMGLELWGMAPWPPLDPPPAVLALLGWKIRVKFSFFGYQSMANRTVRNVIHAEASTGGAGSEGTSPAGRHAETDEQIRLRLKRKLQRNRTSFTTQQIDDLEKGKKNKSDCYLYIV